MPFVSSKERDRLIADVDEARQRAERAEARLHEMSLAMLDTRATKEGSYPVSARLPQKPTEEKAESPEDYHERLKVQFAPVWEGYLMVAGQNGKSEEEAMDWLICHAEGRPLPFEEEGVM